MDKPKRDDKTRRSAAIVAPSLVVVMGVGVGVGVYLQDGDEPDSLATTDQLTESTTTTTMAPVFVAAPPSTTPATTVAPPATTQPTTTTTTIAPTTTVEPTTTVPTATLPAQPDEPIAPPPDPRGFEEQVQLGGISIPAIGLDAPLLDGIRLTTLDNAPGHWPGTALPGEIGNVVIAAHRTSHGAEFRNIDQLVPGDTVSFDTATGVATYKVTSTEIVNPDAIWIINQTDTATATLFACHPPGSVRYRIVVHLELT